MTDRLRELLDRDRTAPKPLRLAVVLVPWWHRFVPCTWTQWGEPFQFGYELYQRKRCTVCGKQRTHGIGWAP